MSPFWRRKEVLDEAWQPQGLPLHFDLSNKV